MLKRIPWRRYLKFAVPAAVAYCIPAYFFIHDARYEQSWLLYVGNFIFMIFILGFLVAFNRARKDDAASTTMTVAGHIVTAMGAVIACLLGILLVFIMVPGIFHPGVPDRVLHDAPANTVRGKTNGLLFKLIMDAIIGNVSTGSFVSIIFPFSLKKDQIHEKVPHQQRQL